MEVKNTLPFFSANFLTENGVAMASTKAAGDRYQVKSLPATQNGLLALQFISPHCYLGALLIRLLCF